MSAEPVSWLVIERGWTVVAADGTEVGKVEEVVGDLYVSGSATLVRAILADGLVDGLHLFVYPLTRGGGPHLFSDDTGGGKLSFVRCESYDNGVVYLSYRPQG